ncbi:hypothetical protein ACFQGT_19155 [Natrialbaceae archaeon GCM10025810]|uniref:hypothetical protein n=1 Tax=Halovalidus salilacus TaxID=3075124 RepID=UPI003606CF40
MTRSSLVPSLALVVGFATTVVVHLGYLPRYAPENVEMTTAVVLVGWLTYVLTFYALGRLLSSPGPLPNMRTADAGVALFLVSLLLALVLDSAGFTPEAVPRAYVLPGVGIYVGLALVGWSIGRRTKSLNRRDWQPGSRS